MRLFNFWKNKNKSEDKPIAESTKVLLAMPIFTDNDSYNLDQVIEHLRLFWQLDVTDIKGDNETAIFNIENTMVSLANMPVPIPKDELNRVIPYSYLWKNADEELKNHTGHAVVSVMDNGENSIDRHLILSKLLCSILLTTQNSIGIYQGQETLLLQRDFYLSIIKDIQSKRITVPAWIYIGIRATNEKFEAYTFGMNSFNKLEIEIIGSELSRDNLYKLILNISSYIIENDIDFEDGDAYKLTEQVLVKIKISDGVYVDGKTLKPQV